MRIREEAFLKGPDAAEHENAAGEMERELEALASSPSKEAFESLAGAGLSAMELDVFLLRLVLDEVPSFDRRCALATGDAYPERSRRSFLEDLLHVLHGPMISGCFGAKSRLFALGLLFYEQDHQDGLPRHKRIHVNPVLADRILGRPISAPGILIKDGDLQAPAPYHPSPMSSPDAAERDADKFAWMIHGPEGAGKRRLARHLAAKRKRPLLEMDMRVLLRDGETVGEIRRAIQTAVLLNFTILIHGLEACVKEQLDSIKAVLDSELSRPDVCFFIVSEERLELTTGISHLRIVELKPPNVSTRERMWKEIAGDYEPASDVSIPELARLFHFTGRQIREAFREARGNAQPGGQVARAELMKICRGKSVSRLSELAMLVEPKFGWRDLVLAPAAMHLVREIEADIRADTRIFEEWYMDRVATAAKGHNILFTGMPGTGKTMAASIIAAELGLELYKIDLSRVSSKYVGDVEKNLAALFDEAEKSNAALFFDEADSLFGKRGENESAQGHYINQQIGYLLQCLESFRGIAFMATNLEKNMDKAFERRFNYVVPFNFPEASERIRIWERAFSPETPIADEVDYGLLGTEFEATGANIKSIALKASRRAAADETRSPMRVTRFDIVYAIVREFDKIVKGWDLDYKGPFRSDIDRVRSLLKGEQ